MMILESRRHQCTNWFSSSTACRQRGSSVFSLTVECGGVLTKSERKLHLYEFEWRADVLIDTKRFFQNASTSSTAVIKRLREWVSLERQHDDHHHSFSKTGTNRTTVSWITELFWPLCLSFSCSLCPNLSTPGFSSRDAVKRVCL